MLCETGCRRHAVTLWWDETKDHTIELCGIHSDAFALNLVAKGYMQIHDDRLEALHPGLGPVTSDPLSH